MNWINGLIHTSEYLVELAYIAVNITGKFQIVSDSVGLNWLILELLFVRNVQYWLMMTTWWSLDAYRFQYTVEKDSDSQDCIHNIIKQSSNHSVYRYIRAKVNFCFLNNNEKFGKKRLFNLFMINGGSK